MSWLIPILKAVSVLLLSCGLILSLGALWLFYNPVQHVWVLVVILGGLLAAGYMALVCHFAEVVCLTKKFQGVPPFRKRHSLITLPLLALAYTACICLVVAPTYLSQHHWRFRMEDMTVPEGVCFGALAAALLLDVVMLVCGLTFWFHPVTGRQLENDADVIAGYSSNGYLQVLVN